MTFADRTLDGTFEESLATISLPFGDYNEGNDTSAIGSSSMMLTEDELVMAPLDHMVVSYSDLDENSSRYDRLVAAPSAPEMQTMWMGWTLVTAICSIISITVFTGILSSDARKKPFNQYLLFLIVPDIVLSVLCCWTCLQNYILGHYSSLWMCHFQSVYCMFSIAGNAWLNAVVCKQMHQMLSSAQNFRRYQPPTHKQVLKHVSMVYIFSAFVASWPLWELILGSKHSNWWPHKTLLVGGVECLPMDFGVHSTIFFYVVFFPCLMAIPLLYTMYLLYDIVRNDRLPPKGKRRQLTIYFFRLVLVFVVMWAPGLLFLFVSGQWLSPWIKWVGGTWCHLQGAVSAIASLWKPDIYAAVKDLVTCKQFRRYRLCRRCLPLPEPELDLEKLQQYRTKRSSRTSLDSSSGRGNLLWARQSLNRSLSWGNMSLLGAFGRSTTTLNTASNGDMRSTGSFGSSLNLPFGNQNDSDSEDSDESASQNSASAHLEDEYNVNATSSCQKQPPPRDQQNVRQEEEKAGKEDVRESEQAFEAFAAMELAPCHDPEDASAREDGAIVSRPVFIVDMEDDDSDSASDSSDCHSESSCDEELGLSIDSSFDGGASEHPDDTYTADDDNYQQQQTHQVTETSLPVTTVLDMEEESERLLGTASFRTHHSDGGTSGPVYPLQGSDAIGHIDVSMQETAHRRMAIHEHFKSHGNRRFSML